MLNKLNKLNKFHSKLSGLRAALALRFDEGSVDSRLVISGSNGSYRNSSGVRIAATTNVARLDHTASGIALGILVEESRTNILLNSFTPATQTVTIANATEYTVSMEGTGSIILSGGLAGTVTDGNPVTVMSTTTSATFTLTGVADTIQCEIGGFATSPIPTLGTAVTRTADSLTMNDVSWFNETEGTFVIESVKTSVDASLGNEFVISASNGTTGNAIDLSFEDGTEAIPRAFVFQAGIARGNRTAGSIAAGVTYKTSFSYALNNLSISTNGATASTDTTVSPLPTGINVFKIGRRGNDTSFYTGTIASVTYYNRQGSATQLQRL